MINKRPLAGLLIIAALSLLVAGLYFIWRKAPKENFNVLIVVFDAMRADQLGAYGSRDGLTPTIDRVAQEGVVFDRAYAQSSWTMSSIASLFTGVYPYQHQVTTDKTSLPEKANTLAEVLASHNYQTIAISANPFITPAFGFQQGFSQFHYDNSWGHNTTYGLTQLSLGIIRRLSSSKPFFMFVHYLDPHDRYIDTTGCSNRLKHLSIQNKAVLEGKAYLLSGDKEVNEKKGNASKSLPKTHPLTEDEMRYLKGLYQCEINAVDKALNRLLKALRKKGLLEKTILIIMSDHGEEFLEHGRLRHGYHLYEETIRVPLIVRLPKRLRTPKRCADIVELVDLYPTILSILGIHVDSHLDGRFLDISQQGKEDIPKNVAFGMTRFCSRLNLAFLVMNKDKLIMNLDDGRQEYFDLNRNPRELAMDAHISDNRKQQLRLKLLEMIKKSSARAYSQTKVGPVQKKLQDKLRSIGYIN